MWEGALDWHADTLISSSNTSASGAIEMAHRHVPEDIGVHSTDVIVRETRRIISAHVSTSPQQQQDQQQLQSLFLYLPFIAPHLPTQPAPGFASRNNHVSQAIEWSSLLAKSTREQYLLVPSPE